MTGGGGGWRGLGPRTPPHPTDAHPKAPGRGRGSAQSNPATQFLPRILEGTRARGRLGEDGSHLNPHSVRWQRKST